MSETTRASGRRTILLQSLVQERHLTREQTIDLLDRRARDMATRDFALSLRQLDRWFAGSVATAPRPSVCRVIEAEFGHSAEELLAPDTRPRRARSEPMSATTNRKLRTVDFVRWIADHSDDGFEHVYTSVAALAETLAAQPIATRAARKNARAKVSRAGIAAALVSYYGAGAAFYRATVGGGPVPMTLGVLTDDRWLDLAVALDSDHEHFLLDYTSQPPPVELSTVARQAAIARLAEVEAGDTVLLDNPLYRLLGVDIDRTHMSVALGVTSFASYALTADLLEAELVDSLAATATATATATGAEMQLPLRDLYLPTAESALSFQDRVCAGGPACLLAVARRDDYLLVIQERSAQVVNMAGKLAVIPKAFHQPIRELHESALSATIERELEEELLGRNDLEQLSANAGRVAAPRHPLTVSEPMRWLLDHGDAYQIDATGFGINLLTGTYEFPCLISVNDGRWWSAYGDRVEANWETMRLHCYSSRDADGLTALIADPNWSNEGLFALLQGLRRLSEVAPDRVCLPRIEVGVS